LEWYHCKNQQYRDKGNHRSQPMNQLIPFSRDNVLLKQYLNSVSYWLKNAKGTGSVGTKAYLKTS